MDCKKETMIVKKRIGKDLRFTAEITTNNERLPLEGRDISVEITAANGSFRYRPEFTVDGSTLFVEFPGTQQKVIGIHELTVWENLGKSGQTVVDRYGIVELVKKSYQENECICQQ